jgi:hypothetical protein
MRVLKVPICAIIGVEETWSSFGSQTLFAHSELMVLGRDKASLGTYFNTGLILARMTILQLVPVSPAASAGGLCPANTQYRNSFLKSFQYNGNRIESVLLCRGRVVH